MSQWKSQFGNPGRQIPDLIGRISEGDLLAIQGPCTHKWSAGLNYLKNYAGLLLWLFVLSPWLFNFFFLLLGIGKRMPGLFLRMRWMNW